MKRDFLKNLGLTDEQIDSVMAENGKDIQYTKDKYSDYEDLKKNLESANATLEKFKDYDQTKADVEKYKAELKKSQEESASKIAKMERQQKIKDFTGSKKFVNDFTKDFINSQLETMLEKDESKGKSLDDLLKEITKDKENIFVSENKPTPPKTMDMKSPSGDSSIAEKNAARAVMGLPPLSNGESK